MTKPKGSKTSLRKPTKPTATVFEHSEIPFTSLDLCAIIETCTNHGVRSFEYGSLKLDFGAKLAPPGSSATHPVGDEIPAPHPAGDAIPAPDHDKINQETLEADELRFREEELLNAPIENPVLAEQLLIDGELEDADEFDSNELPG